MANVIDNMIGAKQIRPVIGVFVPSGRDRAGEYRLGKLQQFANMMVNELVPHIDSAYHTDARSSRRGTMGASDGGHAALYLGANWSGTFGLAAGQSSSITEVVRNPIQNAQKLPVKFYLDVGTYDISEVHFNLLQLNRALRDLLTQKGYEITYAEYHEGHSWGNWRAHTGGILKAFFPYDPADVDTASPVR